MALYSIKINSEALQDIEEAARWYNLQKLHLGIRFQKQVAQQIETLQQRPNSYSIRYKNVRCMKISKFPFLVHFTVDATKNVVNIYGILHTSRNPKIWINRLK